MICMETCGNGYADDWHDNYVGAPTDGSAWVDSNKDNSTESNTAESNTGLRGGSWAFNPYVCRSAFRSYSSRRDVHDYPAGFRVVCDGGRAL